MLSTIASVIVLADEVDGGEGRQRAPGVRADESLDEHGAVLFGELRRLVQDLEAHAVAREPGRVGRADHHAAELLVRIRVDELDELRVRVLAGDELRADDDVRWIEEVQAEEVLAERLAPALGQGVDREAARDRGHDRVGAPDLVDPLEHASLEFEVLGERLEDDVGLGDRRVEVLVVVAGVDPIGHRARPDRVDGHFEPRVGLVFPAREERDARYGGREESAAAVSHRAIRAEDDDVVDLPAPEDVVQFCSLLSTGGLHPLELLATARAPGGAPGKIAEGTHVPHEATV